MARTIAEINLEYTQTLALAGEKSYFIHFKGEEIEALSQEREKLLNKARGLEREAQAARRTEATETQEPTPPQAQDAVETTMEAVQ